MHHFRTQVPDRKATERITNYDDRKAGIHFMDNKNGREEKTPIKLNRKMRMWNRYRNYCIGGVAVLAVLLICVVVINKIGESSSEKEKAPTIATSQVAKTEAPTPAAATAPVATTAPAQNPGQQTPTQQQTTAAVITTGGALAVSGTPDTEEFTTKDYYDNVVFIGDALATGISDYSFLSKSHTVGNYNLTASRADAMISDVTSDNPSKVFVMLGLNDINNNASKNSDTIAQNIVNVANDIKTAAPKTSVYIVSILPVTYDYNNSSNNKITQEAINEVNDGIKNLAATNNNIAYIDLATAFKTSSGYLGSDYTNDGMNIRPGYYPYILNGIAGVAK